MLSSEHLVAHNMMMMMMKTIIINYENLTTSQLHNKSTINSLIRKITTTITKTTITPLNKKHHNILCDKIIMKNVTKKRNI